MRVLVTGGAGYIGSHAVLELGEAGHDVVVYDDLSAGHRWAVLRGQLVEGDLADEDKLNWLFRRQAFDAVIHFAAHVVIPESVDNPLRYYRNNTRGTLGLLEACDRFGVAKLIFSSSAAVYGVPDAVPVSEDAALAPITPYGASKMMSERMIMDVAAVTPLRYVILRYFNVAGADPRGRIGEATPEATHLIKLACETAVGRRSEMTIFGTDYPTSDGTCVRDYIHVTDLARAHVAALDYLGRSGASVVLNCGYGRGASVRQVVEIVRRVSGVAFPVELGARRRGDPPELVAESRLIRRVLDWHPGYDDLEVIVRTALEWERKLSEQPPS